MDGSQITEISQAVAACFVITEMHAVLCLYRYLVPALAKSVEAAAFVDQVFREALRLGEPGELVLVGRRIVAGIHFAAKQ